MFQTQSEAELKHGRLFESGEFTWKWIEISLRIPLFLVTIEVSFDDESIHRDLMISFIADLEDLYDRQNEDYKIVAVSLVSPNYLNGSSTWKLDKLVQILKSQIGEKEYLFVIDDGRVLSKHMGTLDEKLYVTAAVVMDFSSLETKEK